MKTVELARSNRRSRQQPEGDNLFGWTVFILLLCGFAVACWIGTFYIFTHPEEPFNYHILAKLRKLDPPKRFDLTAAPSGEFLTPDKLLAKFGSMNAWQLDEQSKRLLRAYLRNYDHQVTKVPYVTGRFTVLDSFPLSQTNFCDSGFAVLAKSVDVPTVYIEHIFPAGSDQLQRMRRTLNTGLGIELRRSYDLSAIIHVEVLGGGRLLFTCMPLLYGPYGTTQRGSGFQLEPPQTINLKAGLPFVSRTQLREADQRLTDYERAMATQQTASTQSGTKSQPSLVGAEPTMSPVPVPPTVSAGKPSPNTASNGAVAAGQAATTSKPVSAAAPTPKAVPRAVAAASPTPSQRATPPPPAVAAASSQPPQPLQPFLTASPAPPTEGGVTTWQTYRPGQMPRGRLLDVDQTTELADKGLGNATMYLRGDFIVTAVRENRAVLRPKQSFADHLFNRGNARIIVEYQRGTPTPREGDNFQRGSSRPFQIVDVRRGADGQVNIYAREITSAE
jgi:hypothetical protein